MLNIVIPMAGRGSRFANAGYEPPKPLIPIHGRPMIEYVTKNLRPECAHRFVYICLEAHLKTYQLEKKLNEIAPGCIIVPVSSVTEGAACTVLLAEAYIDNKDPLMIANSDQYIETDINEYLAGLKKDGLIMTMKAKDKKWSYLQYNKDRLVTLVKEKEVISEEATTGIYNFKYGADFVFFAKQMIQNDIRVNGEFYVAPVYNEMIAAGKKIEFYNVGELKTGMYGLGVPEDLESFKNTPLSRRIFGEEQTSFLEKVEEHYGS